MSRTCHRCVFCLFVLIVPFAAAVNAGDPCIPSGRDCLSTAPGGIWFFGTDLIPPLPPDFFGPGTPPLIGPVELQGGDDADPNLVIARPEETCIDRRQPSTTVPIEMVQLNLQSAQPIFVPGSGEWQLEIVLAGPTPGAMTLHHDGALRGKVELDVDIQPLYLFTQLEFPGETRIYDTALEGIPPIPLRSVGDVYYTTLDGGDSCSEDGFALGVYLDPIGGDICAAPVCVLPSDDISLQWCADAPGYFPCGPPPNDDCDNAMILSGEVDTPFNTLFALHDGPGLFIRGPNLWYEYIAEQSGFLRVSTCGSGFDTMLAIYDERPCLVDVAPIAISDDSPACGLASLIHIPVDAGQSVFIEVGGINQASGIGWLTVALEYDACDSYLPRRRLPQFDYDQNVTVDLHDAAAFQRCFGGEDVSVSDWCEWAFDTDGDLDVDIFDFPTFTYWFSQTWPPPASEAPLAPICPRPGAPLVNPTPGFSWNPCDALNVVYQLSLFLVPPGADPDDVVADSSPEFTIDGIRGTQAPFPHDVAPLLPGNQYAWLVNAFDADDPAIQLCGGEAVVVEVDRKKLLEDLRALLEHLEELRKSINDEVDEIEDNKFAKEVRLIELIGAILKGETTLGEAAWDGLLAFINCDDAALDELDADSLDLVLEILQGIIRLIIQASDDLSEAQEEVLEGLIREIQRVRDGLGEVSDIKSFTDPDFDVWEHIQGKFGEGLRNGITTLAEKAIAKIAGDKAAGPIVSILEDLYDFGDVLFDLFELDDLREAWNITMLEIINKTAEAGDIITGSEPVDGNVFTAECEADQGGHWKLTPVARCWVPDEGGEAGEGEWVDCDATFAGGARCMEFGTDEMTDVKKGPPPDPPESTGIYRKDFTINFSPDCEGPCYMGVAVEFTAADGKEDNFVVLLGVKPAPEE